MGVAAAVAIGGSVLTTIAIGDGDTARPLAVAWEVVLF